MTPRSYYYQRWSRICMLQCFNCGTAPAATCHPSKATRSPSWLSTWSLDFAHFGVAGRLG